MVKTIVKFKIKIKTLRVLVVFKPKRKRDNFETFSLISGDVTLYVQLRTVDDKMTDSTLLTNFPESMLCYKIPVSTYVLMIMNPFGF